MVRSFSSEPGFEEGEGVVLIVRAVCLDLQLHGLSVSLRDESGAFVSFSEEVLHGEVGEFESDASDDACLSPSGREFDLVAAFGGERIGDINGSRFGIRFDVFSEFCLQCFGVELVHLCEVLHGAFDGIHGEEVARFGSEFASDDVFIDAVISGDAHVVEGGLSSFVDSNFEVDGVVVDVDFDRIHAGEDVAVVVVEVCHGVIFVAESFVEEIHVIDISLLHFQDSFHEVRRIDRVADPGDVSEVVFFFLDSSGDRCPRVFHRC